MTGIDEGKQNMKNHILTLFKPLALSVIAIAFIAFGQNVARADEVTVTGSTTGTVTGVPQLTFAGNSFTGTTALGIGSLSGANRLGTFTLQTGPLQAVSGTFQLNITFTQPAGINGGQNTSYTATVIGSVSPNVDQGGVNITFNQPAGGTVFTFNNGTSTGTFTLTIANLFVQNGSTANLTAGFTGQQRAVVPEPATLLLLGTGLSGAAAGIRRRRRAAQK